MRKVGVIAQGDYDLPVLSILATRIRKGVKVVPRKTGGPVPGKVAGKVREFEFLRNVDSILIVSDAEGESTTTLTKRIRSRLAKKPSLPVKIVIIKEMMEAWLLADNAALARFVGASVSRFDSPENLRDPKAELTKILSKHRIRYTERIAEDIARAANLKTIEKRCPTFELFRRAVLAA
jgi:hypothetical protein